MEVSGLRDVTVVRYESESSLNPDNSCKGEIFGSCQLLPGLGSTACDRCNGVLIEMGA